MNTRSDFYVIAVDDQDRAAEIMIELFAERIPRRFGFDPMTVIQVLCPMNRGSVGSTALNASLQDRVNPSGAEVTRFGRTFWVGDRVLQTLNDYDKGMFNGDLGWVTAVDVDAAVLRVGFDDGVVECGFSELDELLPAYAISVHQSQGSEYPAVIIPVTTQHYVILQRNLLYTAVTRARRLVVQVGSIKYIGIAGRTPSNWG